MYLVLSHPGDDSAVWAALGLRRLGLARVALVDSDALASAKRWDLRVETGRVSLQVDLDERVRIVDDEVDGVLNRLVMPLRAPPNVVGSDRDYAESELAAFTLAWLAALGSRRRLINDPSPDGMGGPWFHDLVWHQLASAAGLETSDLDFEPGGSASETADRGVERRILVIDDAVFGTTDRTLSARSVGLARSVGCRLLELGFLAGDGAWRFRSATARPDLVGWGEPALRALADALRDSERVGERVVA